jgi:hypothetical protein
MIVHPASDSNVLTIERRNDGETALLIFNLSKEAYNYTPPVAALYNKLFDSTDTSSNRATSAAQTINANELFTIKPCSATILEQIKQ